MQTLDHATVRESPSPVDSVDRPLVVDLDGTLIRTDLLLESVFLLMSQAPWRGPQVLYRLRHGKAALKAWLAEQVAVDCHTLPLNEELVGWLRAEKARGRLIYLASASDKRHVAAVAERLGLFDGIFASDGITNLAGAAKAEALCRAFGRQNFDYIGNAAADLPVWQDAAGVVVTNAGTGLTAMVRRRYPEATVISPRQGGWPEWRRALRVHQWLKNLLIFVPAMTAHHFDAATLLTVALAFVSFSLCASSVYVLNDLFDLGHDREHPTKRSRPFAAGQLELAHGLAAVPLALGLALAIGLLLPARFLLVLGGYYGLTVAYSVWLKRQMTLDVVALACLYGIRLVAGATAVAVPISPWLLTFAIFLFFSLALVKRCTELRERVNKGLNDPSGRGYRLSDLPILEVLAALNGNVTVLIFGLYLNSPAVVALYSHPQRLWAIPVVLLYWITRVIILTHRGEMHEDPVLFAIRDRVSFACAGAMVAIMAISI